MINFFADKKNHDFLRLWWAQLISQFGDRLNQMALIGLVAERAFGSTWDLTKILSFTIFPVFIIGPIAGVYVDRWDRRKTLFVCDLIRCLLVLTIPFLFMGRDSMVPIYIVVFLIFCFSRFYVPAKMSIIPDIVPAENLLLANSLITTTGMIAFVLGCALGGFIVDIIGPRAGFIGDAVTFGAAAALVFSIRKDFHLKIDRQRIMSAGRDFIRIERSVFGEIKEGIRYLSSQRDIRFIINMLFVLLAAAGSAYVIIIIFIQKTFHSITKDLGVLAVFLGIGLFLGSLVYGRWGKKVAMDKTIFLCLMAAGGMTIVFATMVGTYPNILLAALLSFFLGFVIGPIFIAANTVVHIVSDEAMRGKVFSALEIVIHFAFLAAMVISSLLSEIFAPAWILVGVGTLCIVVGLIGLARLKTGAGLAIKEGNMA